MLLLGLKSALRRQIAACAQREWMPGRAWWVRDDKDRVMRIWRTEAVGEAERLRQ